MRTFTSRLGVRGFTLAEIIIATAILAFLTVAVYGIGTTGRRSWKIGEGVLESQQRARTAFVTMTNELRLAPNVILADSADSATATFSIPIDRDQDGNIDLIEGTSVVIYGAEDLEDYNNNGEVWEEGWKIEYQIDKVNGKLIRRILDGTTERSRRILASNINSALSYFSYFQAEVEYTEGTASQAININLTVDISSVEGQAITPPLRTALTGSITLRN
jgi:prepilin-type N-terminal cleavage/methylation domain-containing protein